MSSLPPCVLSIAPPGKARTFVAKVQAGQESFATFGTAQLVLEASAFATIRTVSGDFYFVITATERKIDAYAQTLKDQLQKAALPGSPRVEWVRPLTRRLQRLFGWGDVCATKEDVQAAALAEDQEELVSIMPRAAGLIRRGEYKVLRALHDAERNGLPALADCRHEFFAENPYERVPGPCGMDPRHQGPHTRCTECRTIRCTFCASKEEGDARERLDLLRAYHEATDTHSWTEQHRAECTLCDAMPAKVCPCGARRCDRCARPDVDPCAPEVHWQRHPTRPAPFYVIDNRNIAADEKLVWLKQELGQGADLEDFAKKFLELFAEKIRASAAQKKACLELYSKYAGAAYSKESDIPPEERVLFQRAWNPDAAELCQECGRALPAKAPLGKEYCSDACADAGVKIVCRSCGKAESIVVTEGCRYCTACQKGAGGAQLRRDVFLARESELGKRVRQSAESLRKFRNITDFSDAADPDHEPAWKSRRRS